MYYITEYIIILFYHCRFYIIQELNYIKYKYYHYLFCCPDRSSFGCWEPYVCCNDLLY